MKKLFKIFKKTKSTKSESSSLAAKDAENASQNLEGNKETNIINNDLGTPTPSYKVNSFTSLELSQMVDNDGYSSYSTDSLDDYELSALPGPNNHYASILSLIETPRYSSYNSLDDEGLYASIDDANLPDDESIDIPAISKPKRGMLRIGTDAIISGMISIRERMSDILKKKTPNVSERSNSIFYVPMPESEKTEVEASLASDPERIMSSESKLGVMAPPSVTPLNVHDDVDSIEKKSISSSNVSESSFMKDVLNPSTIHAGEPRIETAVQPSPIKEQHMTAESKKDHGPTASTPISSSHTTDLSKKRAVSSSSEASSVFAASSIHSGTSVKLAGIMRDSLNSRGHRSESSNPDTSAEFPIYAQSSKRKSSSASSSSDHSASVQVPPKSWKVGSASAASNKPSAPALDENKDSQNYAVIMRSPAKRRLSSTSSSSSEIGAGTNATTSPSLVKTQSSSVHHDQALFKRASLKQSIDKLKPVSTPHVPSSQVTESLNKVDLASAKKHITKKQKIVSGSPVRASSETAQPILDRLTLQQSINKLKPVAKQYRENKPQLASSAQVIEGFNLEVKSSYKTAPNASFLYPDVANAHNKADRAVSKPAIAPKPNLTRNSTIQRLGKVVHRDQPLLDRLSQQQSTSPQPIANLALQTKHEATQSTPVMPTAANVQKTSPAVRSNIKTLPSTQRAVQDIMSTSTITSKSAPGIQQESINQALSFRNIGKDLAASSFSRSSSTSSRSSNSTDSSSGTRNSASKNFVKREVATINSMIGQEKNMSFVGRTSEPKNFNTQGARKVSSLISAFEEKSKSSQGSFASKVADSSNSAANNPSVRGRF